MRLGWDDLTHASEFCTQVLSAAAGSSGSTIGSVLIFTHGAGSLVVGTALSQNMCVFGSNTRWYSAMAPFGGAKAADEGLNLCASFSAMEDILKDLKVCTGTNKDQLQGLMMQHAINRSNICACMDHDAARPHRVASRHWYTVVQVQQRKLIHKPCKSLKHTSCDQFKTL